MIKAVTFDLDGVYFTPGSFKRFTESMAGNTDTEKAEFVLKRSPQMLSFKMGKISEDKYWEWARKELILEISNDAIFKLLRNCYEVNPEVKDFVAEVKKKGLKACICSNNFVTRIRELDNKFNFLQDFDIKVFSYEEGVMKPEKEIFEVLISRSGVKPGEIIYADDNESKLQGAYESGINAFVYEGFDKFKQKINSLIK